MDIGAGNWALLYLTSEWVIRIAMAIVIPFRRSPEAAKGWLLFAFFLPWPALVLYHLIGRPTYPRWRSKRIARLAALMSDVARRLDRQARSAPDLAANLEQAALLVSNLGRMPIVGGNRLEILAEYGETVDRLVADIDAARDHVHLVTFIFADDAVGDRVVAALGRAKARGVACRVLIDAVGSRPFARKVVPRLSAAGVEVRLALPVRFLRKPVRADLRNHRKIVVIDGATAYVGSQNVVAADFRPGITNQELVVRAQGPVVLELQAVFVSDWFLETEEMLSGVLSGVSPAGSVAAQVLPSGPDHPSGGIERAVVALVHGARERIAITTPYFIPDEALLEALQTAVLRGVEVHLVVSRIPDHRVVNLAQRSYYDELLGAGVRVHLFKDKLLHAKHVSIDRDIALIGSSNIDIRSFLLNQEVSLFVYEPDFVEALRGVEEGYLLMSETLTRRAWAARPATMKLLENIARLLSPLL